jgi:hypothetical protein
MRDRVRWREHQLASEHDYPNSMLSLAAAASMLPLDTAK